MNYQMIIFVFTFIFGIISMLTNTKLFDIRLVGFFDALCWKANSSFLKWLDVAILLGSLGYQIYFWATYFQILN